MGEQSDAVALGEGPVEHANVRHRADVRIEDRVEDQRGRRRRWVPLRRRYSGDDRVEQIRYPLTGLGAHLQNLCRVAAEQVDQLFGDVVGTGRRQIDLVDDRDDGQIVFDREIQVVDGLRLHPLYRVDHQQRSLARRQATADLVVEIDVARSVDQIQCETLTVGPLVVHPDRMALDGDTPLLLELHGVEHLGAHLLGGERTGPLEQAVRQGALAVVDVGDDAKVACLFHELGQKPNLQKLLRHWKSTSDRGSPVATGGTGGESNSSQRFGTGITSWSKSNR